LLLLSCHQAFSSYSPLEVVDDVNASMPTMASGTIAKWKKGDKNAPPSDTYMFQVGTDKAVVD